MFDCLDGAVTKHHMDVCGVVVIIMGSDVFGRLARQGG
jgi:hypothetical protein